jgi:hypothetical protein
MDGFLGFQRKHLTQTDVSLSNIRIASPCPADWAKMIGDERVRHCSECNLNVYNLSAMTEREVAKLIADHRGQRLCARFYRRADGTVLTHDCPWRLRAMARKASRAAATVLTAIMSVTLAFAKNKPKPKIACECQSTPQKEKESGLNLTVMDQQDAVIQSAQITLERKSDKYLLVGTTDSSGTWNQTGLAAGRYKVIVTSPRFRTFNGVIDIQEKQALALKLKLPVGEVNTTVSVEATGGVIEVGAIGILAEQKSAALPFAGAGGRIAPMRP